MLLCRLDVMIGYGVFGVVIGLSEAKLPVMIGYNNMELDVLRILPDPFL